MAGRLLTLFPSLTRDTPSLGPHSIPSSANGTFDRSIFENHLTTSAILGEVMWVTSAPVNWAKRGSFHKHTLPEIKFMMKD